MTKKSKFLNTFRIFGTMCAGRPALIRIKNEDIEAHDKKTSAALEVSTLLKEHTGHFFCVVILS